MRGHAPPDDGSGDVAQAMAMADAALQAKSRAAQRQALQAASLGYAKGVAATREAVTKQVR